MQNPNGTMSCDNCGNTEVNGSMPYFAMLMDTSKESGVEVLYLCRQNGCATMTRNGTPLTEYKKRNNKK